MKKLMALVTALLLICTLVGCGGAPLKTPSEKDTLALLRQEIADSGSQCGVAYLGYMPDGGDVSAWLDNGWTQTFPFLSDLTAAQVVAQEGGEVYCIVPAEKHARVTVEAYDAFNEADPLGDVLYDSTDGAPICLFIDWRQYPSITDALQRAGWVWRGVAVWDKLTSRPQKGRFRQQSEYIVWGSNGPMPVNRPVGCLPGVFRYANPQNRIHVTEKPLQLMRDIVKICEPGGRILDPFAGSGTTVLAAVREGYEAVGIELNDAYFKLGSDRVRFTLEAESEETE